MSSYIHGSEPGEQQRLAKLNELINERCMRLIEIKAGERIIDIGSGLGQLTMAMARKSGKNGFCLGIERDAHQLDVAKSNLSRQSDLTWVNFRQGDVENLPLSEGEWNSFDVGHARFVLEHLHKPEIALSQLVKAIKPGGRVILQDDDHVGCVLHPEPPGFSSLWSAYIRSYDRLGNDPLIGRRLVSMMYEAGLRNMRNDVVFFGDCAGSATFEAFTLNIIGIIETARKVMVESDLIDEAYMNETIRNIREWMKLPYAAIWYQIHWAEGTKPL